MAQRREWMDDLKPNIKKTKKANKKSKIKILSQKVLVDGKFIELSANSTSTQNNVPTSLLTTPHQDKNNIKKELTPTFRIPETYFKETQEVLKKITPRKPTFCEEMLAKTDNNQNFYFKEDLYSDDNFDVNKRQVLSDNSSFGDTVTVNSLSDVSTSINMFQSAASDFRETSTSFHKDLRSNVLRSPTPVFQTSTDLYEDPAASVLQYSSSVLESSIKLRGGPSGSNLQNTPPVFQTYTDLCKDFTISRPQSTSPAQSAILERSTSPNPSFALEKNCVPNVLRSTSPNPSAVLHKSRTFSKPISTFSCPSTALHKGRSASVPLNIHRDSRDLITNFGKDRASSVPRSTSLNLSPDISKNHVASNPRSMHPDFDTSVRIHENLNHPATFPHSTSPIPGLSGLCEKRAVSPSPTLSNNTRKRKINKFPRQCKKKLDFSIAYFDFMDIDDADDILLNEAFPSDDSEVWSEEETTESDEEKNQSTKKKAKKQKNSKKKKDSGAAETFNIERSKPKSEIKKEHKINKLKGNSYRSKKGELIEAKQIKPNPCIGKKCGNGCGEITEERRQTLFNYFWGLQSQQRRKDWIAQMTVKKPVKKTTLDTTNASRRGVTYNYYINDGEERRKVCQQFLIASLDVTQRFILYTAETAEENFAKLDSRGKHGSHNKTKEPVIEHAKLFILSLPLLPSHYCRKDSQRLYLSEDIKNMTNLYNIYVAHCIEDKTMPMSLKVFINFFKKKFNIGFHVPRKDKCNLCTTSKTYDVPTKENFEKMNMHLKEKEESKKRFLFHQTLHEKNNSIICASFDLQKVLNTPHGSNMSLYYSRKIAVYNFTIYESGTRFGFCNIWSETDAHRGANEISSCLLNYIKNVDSRNVKTLLLYADSCFGQNKNKTVLSMLRYALKNCKNLEVIQINFLLPGHTYMPVDSMHATIERAVRKTTIWAPSHWPTVIEMARHNPFPYQVTVLEGKHFMGFNDILNKTFKKSQKLMISKICVATFKKDKPDVMLVKNSMVSDAKFIEIYLGDIGNTRPKLNLYPAKLPISVEKYNDLKKLINKNVIPNHCADEYLNLKHNKKTVDRLADTDEEEDIILMED